MLAQCNVDKSPPNLQWNKHFPQLKSLPDISWMLANFFGFPEKCKMLWHFQIYQKNGQTAHCRKFPKMRTKVLILLCILSVIYKEHKITECPESNKYWYVVYLSSISSNSFAFLLNVEPQIFQQNDGASSRTGTSCFYLWTNAVTQELNVSTIHNNEKICYAHQLNIQ